MIVNKFYLLHLEQLEVNFCLNFSYNLLFKVYYNFFETYFISLIIIKNLKAIKTLHVQFITKVKLFLSNRQF